MWKYIGGGDWIIGVPPRDLSDDEWKRYGPVIEEQQKILDRTLYEQEKAPAAAKTKDTGDKTDKEQ